MSERTIWENTLWNLIWLVMEPPITARGPLLSLAAAAEFETVIRTRRTSNPNQRIKTAHNDNRVDDQEDLPERGHAASLPKRENERMDARTDPAIDALIQANAGTVFALMAFAEALIKERVINADRLIEHLDKPSDELMASGVGPEGMAALNGVIGFLKQAYGSRSAGSPKSN